MENTTALPQVQIDLKATTPVVCEKCQGEVFIETSMFRRVSALLTKNGKEGLLPVPAVICFNCATPLQQFLPKELRSNLVTTSTIKVWRFFTNGVDKTPFVDILMCVRLSWKDHRPSHVSLAQLAERKSLKLYVAGSTPAWGTNLWQQRKVQ